MNPNLMPPNPPFFYHSDHLGSAAYLSNDEGQVTQILNYLPTARGLGSIQNYAETRLSSPRTIHFQREREATYETGFHYYGCQVLLE